METASDHAFIKIPPPLNSFSHEGSVQPGCSVCSKMFLLISLEMAGGKASKHCSTNLFTPASEDISKQLNNQGDPETQLYTLMPND